MPQEHPNVDYGDLLEAELRQESPSAVRLLEIVIQHACEAGGSDLHFNPTETGMVVRMRVDGVLTDAHHLPQVVQRELIARLKVLGGMRTDEHQTPQDGRFRFTLQGRENGRASRSEPVNEQSAFVDVRISIVPTYYGENAVLRLLSSRVNLATLEALGFGRAHEYAIRRALARADGLILITGPTGSGKTSTLYALLHLLNVRDRAIITIEDPIEYSVAGITQIQAGRDGALSLAEGLRSVLRQDPDVIGIGEIRDKETASLATQAALTGHLVLSTLHTKDAATALPRLADLEIESYLIASTVSLIISERLVRRLCVDCRKKTELSNDQKKALATLAPSIRTLPSTCFTATGCASCNSSGYSGRVGVFEVLVVDAALREVFSQKASAVGVRNYALGRGMQPLIVDGMKKAKEGIITVDDAIALAYE